MPHIVIGSRKFELDESALVCGLVEPKEPDDCRCIGCREYLNADESGDLAGMDVVCTCCYEEYPVQDWDLSRPNSPADDVALI